MKPTSKISPVSLSRLGSVLSMSALAASALMLSAGQLCAQTQTSTVYQSNFSSGVDGWLNANASSGLRRTADNELRNINSNAIFLRYFTPTTLGVGDSIKLELSVQLLGSVPEGSPAGTLPSIPSVSNGLRFGLLNSNGDYATPGDNGGIGYTNDAFKGNTGYRFSTNPGGSTSNSNNIGKRLVGDGNNDNPFGGASEYWDSFTGALPSTVLSAGTFYPVVITIARTDATTLGLTYSLNGVTVLATDTSPGSFAFDTLIIQKNVASLGNILVKDVTISYTSQIPEAGQTATAIGVIVAFAAVFMARRRKSRS